MPALTSGGLAAPAPGSFAAPALLMSLLVLSPLPPVIAAETDGEWKCTQAEDTGRWSCARDGLSATDLAGPAPTDATSTAGQIAAEVKAAGTSGAATAAPTEIDPYEARARAAAERIDVPTSTAATTPRVDEPLAAAPAREPAAPPDDVQVDRPVADPEPAPVEQSIGRSAGDIPDFQALAYVPEKPTSLLELPPNFWVAQLMAVSSKEFLESYAEEHNLRGLSAARIASGDRLFFVLILGIYDSKEKAERAITNMPPPYHTHKPLLRTLGSLQDAMRKADQMTGSSDY